MTGLPPIRIHVGDEEVLLDDSRRYVERAATQALEASGAFLAERLRSTAR
jgi:epsilon-lactone hydrolase